MHKRGAGDDQPASGPGLVRKDDQRPASRAIVILDSRFQRALEAIAALEVRVTALEMAEVEDEA